MTGRFGPGISPWPVAMWLFVTLTLVAVSASIAAGLLSPSLVLDMAALWPLLAVALIVVVVAFVRPGVWRILAPSMALVWIFAALVGHLVRSDYLPSGSGDAALPLADVGTAQIVVGPVDQVSIRFDPDADGVEVAMLREGGSVGPPSIVPLVGDGRAEVVVAERDEPGYFRFNGWMITLSTGPAWELDVMSESMRIITDGATAADLTVAGGGVLELHDVATASIVEIDGDFDIVVPPGVGVVVDGEAEVPSDWVVSERGSRSPASVVVWTVIAADGSRVSIGHETP